MILLFGPYSPPITGQSLAFGSVVKSYGPDEITLIDTTRFRSRTISNIIAMMKTLWVFVFHRKFSVVYLSCSRTFFGSLKDQLLLHLCKQYRLKVVNHLQGADFKTFYDTYPRLLRGILHRAYDHVDTSIVLMEGMKEQFQDFPHMNKIVIPNFYSSEFKIEDTARKDQLTVTYFSNLLASKGIFDFLDAAVLIHKKEPQMAFQVAGKFMSDHLMTSKEVQNRFHRFLKEHSHVNIQFHQQIKPGERSNFLSRSSILVLPTYYSTEGLPLVITEAMRSGNAIVTTKHNYLPEIISDKNGVLVPSRNPAAIEHAVLELLSNPEKLRTIQKHNVHVAKTKYSEEIYIQHIKQVLQ